MAEASKNLSLIIPLLLSKVETQGDAFDILKSNINAIYLVIMGSIIIFMQAGFGFLEAGSIRAKNTTNILIKNFVDLTFGNFLGGIGFWLVGYGLAFGEGSNGIIGTSYFAAVGLPFELYPHLFFQATFAATCATIVSGAVAERCNFNAYIIFSVILTSILYPISTHWCWSNGWLAARGFIDFAGSGVVHVSGGIHALIGAIVLGPRIDRFKDEDTKYISGHSIPLTSLGGFILIFGFFAFNAGSQGSVSEPGDGTAIGSAVVATFMGCGSGGVTTLFVWKFFPGGGGDWSLEKTINGCLAGMVVVCAGCDAYYPWVGGALGIVAGCVYLLFSTTLVRLKIDDPLDASPIHLGAGLLGLIANPLLRIDGVLSTFSAQALGHLLGNAIGLGALIGWHLITGIILFKSLEKSGILRVLPEDEIKGLDVSKHGDSAYHLGYSRTTSPHKNVPYVPDKTSLTHVTSFGNGKVKPLNNPDI